MLAAVTMLIVAVFLADRFGLVALIAKGYRTLSWIVLVIYLVPVMTYGAWFVIRARRRLRASTFAT
jgi:uncharacterized membrane protein YkvI